MYGTRDEQIAALRFICEKAETIRSFNALVGSVLAVTDQSERRRKVQLLVLSPEYQSLYAKCRRLNATADGYSHLIGPWMEQSRVRILWQMENYLERLKSREDGDQLWGGMNALEKKGLEEHAAASLALERVAAQSEHEPPDAFRELLALNVERDRQSELAAAAADAERTRKHKATLEFRSTPEGQKVVAAEMEWVRNLFNKEQRAPSSLDSPIKTMNLDDAEAHLVSSLNQAGKMASEAEALARAQYGDLALMSDDLARDILNKSPWMSGAFYLTVFLAAVTALSVAQNMVSLWAFPLVIAGGLSATVLIGALQLRNDGRLSETNFLKLVDASLRRVGSLLGMRTRSAKKPPNN